MTYWDPLEYIKTLKSGIGAIRKNHIFTTGPPNLSLGSICMKPIHFSLLTTKPLWMVVQFIGKTLPSLAHLGVIATTFLLGLKVSKDATIPLPDTPCFPFRHAGFGKKLSSFQWLHWHWVVHLISLHWHQHILESHYFAFEDSTILPSVALIWPDRSGVITNTNPSLATTTITANMDTHT